MLSVIIPVFNDGKNIIRCLDALKSDELLEVIIVNDGSTDDTQNLVDEFIAENKSKTLFKLYNIENKGSGKARRYGISLASGDYLGFIDSDDVVIFEKYINLYKKASKMNIPIAMGRRNIHQPMVPFTLRNRKRGDKVIDINQNKEYIFLLCHQLWDKLYRKDIIQYYDSVGSVNEDIECVPYIYAKAGKVLHTDDIIYDYYRRTNSMSFGKLSPISINGVKNVLYPLLNLKKRFVEANLYDNYKDEINAIFIMYFFEMLFKIKYSRIICNKDEIFNVALDIFEAASPNWQGNKYYKSKFKSFEYTYPAMLLLLKRKINAYQVKDEILSIDRLLGVYENKLILKR